MRTRLFAALLLSLASAAVLAQSQPAPPPSTPSQPTFRVEANYVRVDMYAMQDDRVVGDLRPEEIELTEDGVAQRIEDFEFVTVRPAGPQGSRVEPRSIGESRQMAADPRARVFVIFLDTYHTQVDGSWRMRRPIVQFLERVIGQDDLVAVMTPEMSARDITLARKTVVLERLAEREWTWGRRADEVRLDPTEERYRGCYARFGAEGDAVTREMTARRREQITLDALDDLVRHLRGLRDERKAVLTISEGWVLHGPNTRLAGPLGREGHVPRGPEPIFVGPEGRLRRGTDPKDAAGQQPATLTECDADRMALALLDNGTRFRATLDAANRANVSFYPIYPRGLAVFDAPIGPAPPPPPSADIRSLATRHDSLRELAETTDGLAVVNTNDIEGAMRRIVSDLTSYYLLGYYSTNGKLDGKYRNIEVRVKRPGVAVRHRRGYRARTADTLLTEVAATTPAADPKAVTTAIGAVGAVSSRATFRLRTATWPQVTGGGTAAAAWIVGEMDYRALREPPWSAGATADITVLSSSGAEVMSSLVPLSAGTASFSVRVPETGGLAPGDYAVRVRVRPLSDTGLPVSDTARLVVPAAANVIGDAVLWRRGPSTGPRHALTADPRFRRNERVRMEFATTAAGSASARLLDRAGRPLQVPVQVSERPDPSGEFRWIVADTSLAPLAPGDYAVEVVLNDGKQVAAFKVVP